MANVILSHPLTRRLPPRPELEVPGPKVTQRSIDGVVAAIPVDVMNGLVRREGTSEKLRHEKAMLRIRGDASGQVTQFDRDRDVPVATTVEAGAWYLADRLVRLHVAVLALSVRVGATHTSQFGCTIAARDSATARAKAQQRLLGTQLTPAEKAEVVRMAEAAFGCVTVAVVRHALLRRGT